MDSKFRSSFIPKTSLSQGTREEKGSGFFGAVAILIFIVAIVGTGGLYFYKKMLQNENKNLQSQLATAGESIDSASIDNIILFDRKIKSIKEILKNHVAITEYFNMLENSTVSTLQFSDLKYSFGPEGNISVQMSGKAKSYGVVALQEDTFKKNPNAINIRFNGLKSDKRDGIVSFTFNGDFKSDLVKFKLPKGYLSSDDEKIEEEAVNDLGDLPDLENI